MTWQRPIHSRRPARLPWHLWFAWYPVAAQDERWYWLERVKRSVDYPMGWRCASYRPLDWKVRP